MTALHEQSLPAQCITEAPGDRPFQCQAPGCGRRFNRKFTLTEHIKTHTVARPFVCPEPGCAKRFSRSGNMSRHKRLHSSIKLFECSTLLCTRTFPSEAKLQRHLRIHLGERCYTCKVAGCNKSYSTTGNLTRHMKNHHDFQQEYMSPASSWISSSSSSSPSSSSSSSSSCPTTPSSPPFVLQQQQSGFQPLIVSVGAFDGKTTPALEVGSSMTNTMTQCAYEPITSPASASDLVDFLGSAFFMTEDAFQSTDSMLMDCVTPALIDDVVQFELGHAFMSDSTRVE